MIIVMTIGTTKSTRPDGENSAVKEKSLITPMKNMLVWKVRFPHKLPLICDESGIGLITYIFDKYSPGHLK